MSWESLNEPAEKAKLAINDAKAERAALAKDYHVCFNTEQGKRVLEHLVKHFIMGNDTQINSQNVNYEAAYHNGESGVVKYIINQIEKAETL